MFYVVCAGIMFFIFVLGMCKVASEEDAIRDDALRKSGEEIGE